MKYIAEIDVMPKKEILDPQGKAVRLGLGNLGLTNVSDVRIGRHITLELEAANEDDAKAQTITACEKLLANLIMESFQFKIFSA